MKPRIASLPRSSEFTSSFFYETWRPTLTAFPNTPRQFSRILSSHPFWNEILIQPYGLEKSAERGREIGQRRGYKVYDDPLLLTSSISISILRSSARKHIRWKFRVTFIGEYLRLLHVDRTRFYRARFLFGDEKKSKVKERKEYRQRVRCIEYFRCNLCLLPPLPTINIQPTFECLKFNLRLISVNGNIRLKLIFVVNRDKKKKKEKKTNLFPLSIRIMMIKKTRRFSN